MLSYQKHPIHPHDISAGNGTTSLPFRQQLQQIQHIS